MTSKTIPNATSSPESGGGQLRLGSPDGVTTHPCGQAPAPASPSQVPESAKDMRMREISGRYGSGSLRSAHLQSCLESRLRVQLPTAGGMAWPQIWKAKVTPALRRYCQLALSGKPIEGKDYGMWELRQRRNGLSRRNMPRGDKSHLRRLRRQSKEDYGRHRIAATGGG